MQSNWRDLPRGTEDKESVFREPDSDRAAFLYEHGEIRDLPQVGKLFLPQTPMPKAIPIEHVNILVIPVVEVGQTDRRRSCDTSQLILFLILRNCPANSAGTFSERALISLSQGGAAPLSIA